MEIFLTVTQSQLTHLRFTPNSSPPLTTLPPDLALNTTVLLLSHSFTHTFVHLCITLSPTNLTISEILFHQNTPQNLSTSRHPDTRSNSQNLLLPKRNPSD